MEFFEPAQLGVLALLFLMAAAFFAGVVDSVAGGGGLISLPATLLVGLPPQTALGTGKFMACIGTTASFATYAAGGVVLWRIVAAGVPFAFLGSIAGAKTALFVDNALLGKIILCLLPAAAALTFAPMQRGGTKVKASPVRLYVLTPLLCLLIGFYDGFFGPGTGSFLLLALHAVLGLGLVAASGTAKAFNLASNASSLAVFILSAKVCYAAAVPMAAANMAGNVLGSRLALKKGPRVVRYMLFVSLSLLCATLIWRYFFAG